jgi:peptide/nickel transport system permease protein
MRYLAGRLVLFALTLLLISVVTFAVTHILPGDVATMIMGTRGNPTSIAALQEKLGLNDPLILHYGRWSGGMLCGEWGVSLRC